MDTAVIGVAFRFPGAADEVGFWENLDARRSSVTEIPHARWDWRPLWGDPKLEPNKSFSKWGGFIDDVDAFDHEFFGLLPKVVRNMDPQQRIMLELAWSSLEDAGVPPASLRGRPVGVFVGVTHHDYKELLAGARVEIGPYHYTGTATVVVPNRISHALGLRGPSIPIDTACSSALNAIHTAIQSLETGECELALAGGVSLILNPARHISVSKMGTLSPTGSCKTLDERADGYVRGEGAGFFVLKPLDKAMADGDRIHGVIKGSAINHCGEAHTLTYPSAEAQAAVIVAAHERAGVPVDSVNFVELHGTGTAKGDPIEFEGLTRAFAHLAERQGIALSPGFCGLSSAKTNLGHLEAAAGMAGVAKVLLAFRHRRLPGFHDFRTLNPRVSIDGTPFRILAQTVPWRPARDGVPLRAGISAFGFGGTNAHLILEEPPAVAQRKGSRRSPAKAEPCLIVLSARTADALQRRREDLAKWLDDDAGEHTLREISRALLLGRDHMPFRFACVVDSLDALRDALRTDAPNHAPAADAEAQAAMRAEAEALLADARKRNKAQALQRLRRLETLYIAIGNAAWRRLFDDAPARRPSLPTYPFARHRFWLPETRLDDPALDGARTGATKTIETPASLVDSLYAPHWRTEAATAAAGIPSHVVLIGDAEGLDRLEPRLRASPRFAGTRFERIEVAVDAGLATGDGSEARLVHPDAPDRHADAVAALAAKGVPLDRIVLAPLRVPVDDVAARVSFSARHLFALVKAMMRGTRSARFVQLAPPGEGAMEYAALDGFFKTLRIEKPSYSGRVVLGAWDAALDPRLAEIVADELADAREASCIRHRVDGAREAFGFTPVAPTAAAAVGSCGFREGGTYLITGGLGGIGRVVAQHLCTHHRAHVYLTGRAPASDEQRETMAALCARGGQVSYVACDPSDRGSVRDAIAAIRAQGRRLNGVLHSAGMIQDNFILRKTPEEFARVIAPKTLGTVHLDLETRDEPLDFFALFSSIAGVMGNVGQADYAYGNAFEDAYAHWREALRANGECRGRAVSINWPFWRNGGMRMGEAEIAAVRRSFGIVPLEDAAGIDALEFALGRAGSQLIVMPGDAARVRESMGVTAAAPVATPAPAATPAAAPATDPAAEASVDLAAVHAHLAKFIADELNMSAEFEPDKSFKDYGVDSVVMIELIAALEKLFGTLPKTLFFEYPTLNELSGYFHEQHGRTTYASLLRPARAAIAAGPSVAGPPAVVPPASSPLRAPLAAAATGPARQGGRGVNDEPIAVIGLAGRYPQADTLDAFWQNLSQGRDCIEEIPEDRPDLAAQFRFRPGEPARAHAYAKWGGFLRDVDRFDAVFFNISPKEAQDLDPNERLFLEIVAHAIEDAGYTPPTLAAGYAYRENPVGVYVGVMWGDYQLHGVDRARDAWVTPHAGYWAVANRVSYQFNFSGPSMAVDTACSSSLTAIHLACQALRCGDIEAAVAGAVNLSLHPNKYNLLADMHMLAVDGRCRAFGADGSGYVPGEGVGAAILKPLSKALRDGDHVYGLIRGTAINHGGKASGFTVPNPNRQAALIREALDVSAVDPRHVSYVEAHGTGTSLGDPIEIAGLTKAYEQNEVQYCAIGSAKSNIGHLEGAAGIAGLTKVLLQMRHRQLAPSIHADTLNPYIDFARSPFRVQRSLQPWHRPTIVRDGVVTELPRLAGLSSFGAGGANGHVIVEEYVDDVRADALADAPALFVLSARREPVLRTMAARLAQRLEAEPGLGMRDVAYTLQVGRVAHEFRVAIVADTREALLHALQAFADRGELPARAWSGHRDDGRRDAAVAARLSAALPQVPQWLDNGDLASLASAWTVGAAIDWSRLHAQGSRRRVPLPGYPFQRQRYWVDTAPPLEASGVLHPLVDANVSTLDEQAYSKVFRPDEFFLRDHRLGDNRVLPGVVYLETALQAARLAAPGLHVKALCDVQWIRPVVLDADPLRMRIVLAPERDAVAFELQAADDPARAPYAHGHVVLDEEAAGPGPADVAGAPERHDLQAIMQRCERFERAQVDAVFTAMGFTFGSSFQVYDALYCNADEALGCLRLPPIPGVDHGDFVLHPALLDGSTRACLGIGGLLSAEKVVHVPVKLGRVEIHGRLGDRAHAYARRATDVAVGPGQQAFDVALCDDDGRVCIRLVHLIGQAAPQLTLAMGRAQAGARPPLPASRTPAAAVPMASVPASVAAPIAQEGELPVDRAIALLTQLLADVTRLPASEIDPRAPLENYGIDSLMIATLNRDLDARFGAVPKTLFFEYRELAGVAGYLAEQHADALRAVATAPAAAIAPVPAPAHAPSHVPAAEAVAAGTDDVHAGVNEFLKGIVAETTGLPMSEIDPQAPMENYGIDSMMIVKLTGRIEQAFGPVSKTLFFEYQELDGLARHLAEAAPDAARAVAASKVAAAPAVAAPVVAATDPSAASIAVAPARAVPEPAAPAVDASVAWPPAPPRESPSARTGRRFGRFGHRRGDRDGQAIAIIGLAGHYPHAEDLATFWRNLESGRDCIGEIPPSRWDHTRFFHPDRNHKGTAYGKWGGFMDDIDRFDARFFNISAREAVLMDPQERLFLQTAWECVEDASHTRQSLKGHPVGVFVGVAWQYYAQFEVSDAQLQSGRPSTPLASIANRVSYFMNFSGPSMVLDTMCSSSLTAIHLACRAIENGDCALAIAGGVNVMAHSNKYLQLSAGQFLSTDGRCRAFGTGGDGYVPGEGVGAVLLKPLERALEDGDHVYGVIRGTALNHGGKTNGFTVPSQGAQTEVIGKALERAGWDPGSIGYLEAHGTGTSLGDPIEIAGLARAFSQAAAAGSHAPPAPQSCRIGSVKSGIGHLESAAGIAGLTRILLQFRHGTIAPSLHSSTLNPAIDFARTPFRVPQQAEPWPATGGRRRAGISSFGAGGSNAHCLVEDHPAPTPIADAGPSLFLLSADSEERLARYVDRVIAFLEGGGHPDIGLDLASLAYSSQVGREAMDERLAVVASDVGELLAALRGHRRGEAAGERVVRGASRKSGEKLEAIVDEAEKDGLIRKLIAGGRLAQLARAWVSLLDIDWARYAEALHAASGRARPPHRMPFPTMPFVTQRYWVDEKPAAGAAAVDALHPLLDRNVSDLSVQAYHKRFDGHAFYLRDHVIDTGRPRRILPGAAYLEMARVAGDLACAAAGLRVAGIRRLMWLQPFEIDAREDGLTVRLRNDEDALRFDMVRDSDGVVCVEGELALCEADAPTETQHIDLAGLLASAEPLSTDTTAIYAGLQRMGFRFGPSFQVTQARYRTGDGVLSRLQLPGHLRAGLDAYGLHPALLDAVLRSGLAVLGVPGEELTTPIVPFALASMDYVHPLPETCFVHAVACRDTGADAHAGAVLADPQSALFKCDLVVADADGRVLLRLDGIAGRAMTRPGAHRTLQYFGSAWTEQPLAQGTPDRASRTLLAIADDDHALDAIAASAPPDWQVIRVTLARGDLDGDRDAATGDHRFDPDQTRGAERLFAALQERGVRPDRIVLWQGGTASPALTADRVSPAALRRGMRAVRRLFIASEAANPGAAIRMLYVYADAGVPQPQHEAVSGFARSLLTVNHRFELSTFRCDPGDHLRAAAAAMAELAVESGFGANEIASHDGRRHRRSLHALDATIAGAPAEADADHADDAGDRLPLRERGAYLITGGGGKLGMVVARWMAEHCQARLLLSGRSAQPSPELAQAMAAMRACGADVEYRSADSADRTSIDALAAYAERRFGALHGVVHCAGIASDRSVLELDDAAFDAILAPKVEGLIALDQATAHMRLDFFALFSSVSAVIGDLGSCAYAAGNRFMDGFAPWREHLRAQGLRSGMTFSIDWPLWATGGMDIAGTDASVFGFSGMQALTEREGLDAFGRILRGDRSHVLVAVGDPDRIARTLRLPGTHAEAATTPAPRTQPSSTPIATMAATAATAAAPAAPVADAGVANDLVARAEHYVKQRIAIVTRTTADAIDARATFEQCGMDSVLMLELHAALRADIAELPKTALFEYDSAGAMARHLVAHHGPRLAELLGAPVPAASTASMRQAPAIAAAPAQARPDAVATRRPPSVRAFARSAMPPGATAPDEGIAIVGIAGEFPDAPDLSRFWQHLREGRDCLIRIPDDRGFASSLGRQRSRSGKPISDKGGFIADVDLFDPALFRMSQAEADKADPQLRVLLRTAWRAVEDAAYTPQALAASRVGVFVGTMNDDFTRIAAELQMRSADFLGPGSVSSELSNRLSFLMDFCGPSVTVSTACSASLTALHLARRSILAGDCEVALVGGINLSLHKSKYQLLHEMNVLSPDGQERTFDERANGLVPSEGAAAVLLKPLGRALADGDHVYGVIRGSRIGHSGTGAGQFMPNLRVMEDTAAECIREAGIQADELTYLETHGTGTELGDPIELKALANALRRGTDAVGHCAIGSKANIGHMEAASGLGSLIKVLLSMRHGEVAPCAKLDRINSSFDHARSPFRFPTAATPWPRNARGTRVAGINSFGMGGSNAFVVVESIDTVRDDAAASGEPVLFVLSARSEDGLRRYALTVADAVRARTDDDLSPAALADLAYASQVGRIGFRHRLAVVARDAEALIAGLIDGADGASRPRDGVYRGDTESAAAADTHRLLSGDAGARFVETLIGTRQWNGLADLWVRGVAVDWAVLHRGQARRRCAFPGVPFEWVRCDLRHQMVALPGAAMPIELESEAAAIDDMAIAPDAGDDTGAIASGWCRLATLATPGDDAGVDDDGAHRYWTEHLGDAAETAVEVGHALTAGSEGHALEHDAPGELYTVSEVIDTELVRTLQAFGVRHGIAVETMVAAAWAVLVNRYTKAKYSQFGVLGTGVDGEARLLPVRVRTVGRQKILAWLTELQATLLGGHRGARSSLATIGEWVGRTSLFDSVVAFDGGASSMGDAGEPRIELVAMAEDDALELSLIYRAATPGYISAGVLLQQITVLLEGIAGNPDRMPSALAMRTRDEGRERLWKTMEAMLE